MAGTRWVRLDVGYFRNPKAIAAGRDGRDLHIASLCWVGEYLTDGHIPPDAVAIIAHDAGLRRVEAAVSQTVDSGLWTPNGDGYHIRDFVAMNGSREDVEREREKWRKRQADYRRRRGVTA